MTGAPGDSLRDSLPSFRLNGFDWRIYHRAVKWDLSPGDHSEPSLAPQRVERLVPSRKVQDAVEGVVGRGVGVHGKVHGFGGKRGRDALPG